MKTCEYYRFVQHYKNHAHKVTLQLHCAPEYPVVHFSAQDDALSNALVALTF
jgi:hypothetical protein